MMLMMLPVYHYFSLTLFSIITVVNLQLVCCQAETKFYNESYQFQEMRAGGGHKRGGTFIYLNRYVYSEQTLIRIPK